MLELTEETYEAIKKSASEEQISVESYLTREIEIGRLKSEASIGALLTKELESLLQKIKSITEEKPVKEKGPGRITFYRYEPNHPGLPEKLKEVIGVYEEKGWFQEKNFHLLLDENNLVGYLGLSPHEEALPYGSYLFIYSLHLAEAYQNQENLKLIASYIQTIGKENAIYSIDISSPSTNLSQKQLTEIGFIPFENTAVVTGRLLSTKQGHYERLKEESNLSSSLNLDEMLIFGRIYPSSYWKEGLERKNIPREVKAFILQDEDLPIIIGKELVEIDGEACISYTVLLEANTLFDEHSLKRICIALFDHALMEEEGKRFKITVPYELISILPEIYEKRIYRINWYRKIIN